MQSQVPAHDRPKGRGKNFSAKTNTIHVPGDARADATQPVRRFVRRSVHVSVARLALMSIPEKSPRLHVVFSPRGGVRAETCAPAAAAVTPILVRMRH